MSLLLYNFFHLNLAYSAIAESDRLRVIERCYWPLLNLARKHDLPFSIELSAYTLRVIDELDPSWVRELTDLINNGNCELIGSGYAQIIAPLVPSEVTCKNLQIGGAEYERITGVRPRIALLNEQAFSSGTIPLYVAAGYEAVVMEWDNPATENPNWNPVWRYFPQRIKGSQNSHIPVVWNHSISFQKFQRYAHGELTLHEIVAYIKSHQCSDTRAFSLYGNDVEIFDYRPGRYMTESQINGEGEWLRIAALYAALLEEPKIRFIKTSDVLELRGSNQADHLLRLESAAQPIPVKKQDKYNVIRWAVTGRDDRRINSRCWRIFDALRGATFASQDDWMELCYLWSSDFRTHITQERWDEFQDRLSNFEQKWAGLSVRPPVLKQDFPKTNIVHRRMGRYLEIKGQNLFLKLNCSKGLAVDEFRDLTVGDLSAFGTLHHGYFDDIHWSADFYSGHFVFQSPGHHKVTDLVAVEPDIKVTKLGMMVTAVIKTPLGKVFKTWFIDDQARELRLNYRIHWNEPLVGSLRLGYVTLNPAAFEAGNMNYQSHNGGTDLETFTLKENIAHGAPLSFLLSASQAVGMTSGLIATGDRGKQVKLQIDKTQQALVGMVTHQGVNGQKFTRICLSALEHDDTSKPNELSQFETEIKYSLGPFIS